jgi:hypothetical protein
MATRLAEASQDAMADAVAALLDGGSIEIRTGYQPATPDDTATGTLLATLTLNNPAFGAASAGAAALSLTPAITAVASGSGTAGWFRALTSGSAAVLDGSCSASGGGGDMFITNTAVVSGQSLSVVSWSIEMPAS